MQRRKLYAAHEAGTLSLQEYTSQLYDINLRIQRQEATRHAKYFKAQSDLIYNMHKHHHVHYAYAYHTLSAIRQAQL